MNETVLLTNAKAKPDLSTVELFLDDFLREIDDFLDRVGLDSEAWILCREYAADTLAYFYKYGYLCLPSILDRASYEEALAHTESPRQFLERTRERRGRSPEAQSQDLIVLLQKQLTAAPWMGMDPEVGEQSDERFFAEIVLHAMVELGYLQIRLESDLLLTDEDYCIATLIRLPGGSAAAFEEWYQDQQSKCKRRTLLVEDLGLAYGKLGRSIDEAVAGAQKGDVIKIFLYSGLTIFNRIDRILAWTKKNTVQVLTLGSHTIPGLQEGADPTTFERAIRRGGLKLAADDRIGDAEYIDRLEIRMCGFRPQDGFMRGCLIVDPVTNRVKDCVVSSWDFETERGSYGQLFRLAPGSSLAQLVNTHFDSTFSEAVPANRQQRKRWYWKQIGPEAGFTLFVAAFAIFVVFWNIRENWGHKLTPKDFDDSFYAAVVMVPASLAIARRLEHVKAALRSLALQGK